MSSAFGVTEADHPIQSVASRDAALVFILLPTDTQQGELVISHYQISKYKIENIFEEKEWIDSFHKGFEHNAILKGSSRTWIRRMSCCTDTYRLVCAVDIYNVTLWWHLQANHSSGQSTGRSPGWPQHHLPHIHTPVRQLCSERESRGTPPKPRDSGGE